MTLLTPAPAPGLLTTALPKFTPDMEVPIAGPAAVTKDQARIADLEGQLQDMGESLAAITSERDHLARRLKEEQAQAVAILSELQGANGKLEDLRAILRVGRLGLLPDDMSVEDGLARVLEG